MTAGMRRTPRLAFLLSLAGAVLLAGCENPQQPEAPDVSVGSLAKGASPRSITAETVAAVFGATSGELRRGVLLAVRPSGIGGMAQYGLPSQGDRPNARVRSLRLPLSEPSVLSRVVSDQRAHRGEMERNRGNQALARCLGGPWPRQAVVVPLRIDDNVRLLFYGDNEPQGDDLPAVDGLATRLQEALASSVGSA